MIQSRLLNRFDEVKEADALFKGSDSLGNSGYWPLGHPEAKTATLPLPPSELYPGLLECMGACLSFTQVFTHGDLGIYEKAYSLVNNQDPANVIRVEGQKITPRPGIKKILVTGVHKTYDSEALDSVLSACREKNPQLTVYLFRGERIEPKLDKKFGVQHLEYTWAKYLEAEEFHQKYYRQRLARLYKETRYWPRIPDYRDREEFGWLEKAIKQYQQVHVYGSPGVGKTALLAKLADKLAEKNKNQKNQSASVVWVNLDTPAVTRAEILIGMGLQLGLEEPLHLLEHKDPTGQLLTLEKKIQRKIETEKILVIIDSLDAIFRPGRIGIGDPAVQELLTGWVAEKLTIGKLSGPSHQNRLVFTGDIRVKENKDSCKPLKIALSRVIKEDNQKIGVQKLTLEKQEEMLLGWLGPVAPAEITPQNRQEMRRLFQLAGGNLRILRFLAIWAVEAGGMAQILPHLEPIEKAEPWRKEDMVISHCFKKLRPQEQFILDALEGIGRQVHRQVICSAPGMEASLSALIQAELVIYNKEDKTYEPLYRFGREQSRRKTPVKVEPAQERSLKKSRDGAILNCKLLGGITEQKISTSAGYYRAGAALCEQAVDWELWEDAPLIDAPGLVAKARYFLKIAKNTTQDKSRKKFAAKALELAEKSRQLGVGLADSHFISAQALDVVYPRTHEKEIENHYEKSIALEPYADKLYGYARYINRRSHDRERVELKFKEAGSLEEKRGRVNVIGMNSFAEFYLGWPGHEQEAGDVLNRIIAGEKNKTRNFFLAGRLYQALGWRYLATYFYEGALKEEPKDVRILNSYANAGAAWGDRAKAQELYERALKADDKHVPTLNGYANASAEWGEKEKAKELFERALALEPGNEIVINSYSTACAAWGEAEKAPVQPVQPVRPDAQPAPTPTHGTGQEEAFTLTPAEKTWLTAAATSAKSLSLPAENAQWAGFSMLYSLFYWKEELASLKERGIIPTLQQDYQRLYNLTGDLEELVVKSSIPSPAQEIFYREEWFNREDIPQERIAYYDGQVLLHPGNPVCMAFLVRALENFSWKGTARILKKEILNRVPPTQIKEWQTYLLMGGKSAPPPPPAPSGDPSPEGEIPPVLTGTPNEKGNENIDILTAGGRQKFQAFLQEQNRLFKAQTQAPGYAGFTYEVAFTFLNRLTTVWQHAPRYFPWQEFTPREVTQVLGKLLALLGRLKGILAEVRDLKAEALDPLGEFLREIMPLVGMMQRLSHAAYEQNKPELTSPIPGSLLA